MAEWLLALRSRTGIYASNGQTRTSLAEINITPLVDVVLVLLVIFMITEPVLQSGIEVNVPKTRTVKQITEQRMVVTIDRDQQYFPERSADQHSRSAGEAAQAGVDPAHQSIYLRSDERVPFGAFASVMDAVKQSGITNVSIVTQPLETKGIGGKQRVAVVSELASRDVSPASP